MLRPYKHSDYTAKTTAYHFITSSGKPVSAIPVCLGRLHTPMPAYEQANTRHARARQKRKLLCKGDSERAQAHMHVLVHTRVLVRTRTWYI